ncbi:hypothetical protein JOF56_003859 [Kibdelosporangium banguiense]|uniref:Uncharacterized protein n=1 Tax=Kibdelosporangium banguiense TaxID=1365924 RepID=A0ABS4TGC4_9PSEU|nr:hypothetical protein [Kibdelosporangium banguiense]MBP2323474.1 hypothetical protein [Kibdelosporangium banguiense]
MHLHRDDLMAGHAPPVPGERAILVGVEDHMAVTGAGFLCARGDPSVPVGTTLADAAVRLFGGVDDLHYVRPDAVKGWAGLLKACDSAYQHDVAGGVFRLRILDRNEVARPQVGDFRDLLEVRDRVGVIRDRVVVVARERAVIAEMGFEKAVGGPL